MVTHISGNIWAFRVILPGNPLKWLNTYVIRGEGSGRDLLIDTGFKRHECLSALLEGMSELGLRPENTDVLVTHLHSDHTGNAPALAELGCRILMGRIDHEVLNRGNWPERKARALREGMPEAVMRVVFEHNPAVLYAPEPFGAELLEDGECLSYGGHRLRCVLTPGHTPGHICLYEKESGTMFLGDHVLFDITPNIVFWEELEDSLGAYMDSLRRIMECEVTLALPGHRTTGDMTMRERAEQILAHHESRLAEAERVIREEPGLSAYEIAGRMTWRIRASGWDDFPPGQKWFAMGEALAHVDHLTRQRRVLRNETPDGLRIYSAQ